MKRYLQMELTRAFRSKKMVLALGGGLFLSLWHAFVYIFPLRDFILLGDYPLSAYHLWLGGECYSLESTLYYMLIPVLCALPYGDSWQFDCAGSLGGQCMIRGGQKEFVLAKMAVSFLAGAAVSVLPLLFDLLLTGAVIPLVLPKAGMGLSPIGAESLLADLFYTHPGVYTALYLVFNGLFFGVLNTLSMAARLVTASRYMAILTPFACYMVLHCAGTTTGHFELVPSGFLRPCQQFVTTGGILAAELIGLGTVSLFAAVRYMREEPGLL